MISGSRLKIRAGPTFGLLFLFLLAIAAPAAEVSHPAFQPISSTCIDLASYETNQHELTVRFTGGSKDKFYRYSNVSTNIWSQILRLNGKGTGVGAYFIETVVDHPKTFPFEIVWQPAPIIAGKNKKAEDSK